MPHGSDAPRAAVHSLLRSQHIGENEGYNTINSREKSLMAKILQLLSILPSKPTEFFDRLRTVAEVKLDQVFRKAPAYTTMEWKAAIDALGDAMGDDLSAYLAEAAMQDVEAAVLEAITRIPPEAPFRRSHNGDLRLARLSYALCRATRPQVALETGTCYGVSTAYVLKALQVNGLGVLHSIDLPPLGKLADRFVGFAIPDELKSRWTLYRGLSHRIMPKLLHTLNEIDFFLHDSLHTYGNMLMECDLAYAHLSERSAVVVDDIEANAAFRDWVDRSRPNVAVIVRELRKPALFGAGFFENRMSVQKHGV
jgi:hypothetical protein